MFIKNVLITNVKLKKYKYDVHVRKIVFFEMEDASRSIIIELNMSMDAKRILEETK